MRSTLRSLCLLAAIGVLAAPAPRAQVRPLYDLGAAGLAQALQRLQTTASVLHTGAHPDDEDSAFLARAARGDHARVAYLSLTRGEGGQNFIGSELFEALGVIRSEELLQARRLDGGGQFFTRAIDFGFSKTRAEAAAMWGERELLGDMVRVIRTFRPLVVYARFSGTPADGHGHHQLAGALTPLAFRAAADPAQFPQQIAEGLRPWQARKLYQGLRQPGADVLEVATGRFDPVIGRSYAEIAAEGRSQHKSQEMGTIERRGESSSYLRLIEVAGPNGRAGAAPPSDGALFAGIDTSVPGIAALAGLPEGALRAELEQIAARARQALDAYEPLDPAALVPVLAAGLSATRTARTALAMTAADASARADADFLLAHKEREFGEALARASGVVVDALADEETVPQGSSVGVTVRAFYPEGSPVRPVDAGVRAPQGWTVSGGGDAPPQQGFFAERADFARAYSIAVPATAPVTQPYYLDTPPAGALYQWIDDEAERTRPFAEGPLVAWVTLEIGGSPVTVARRVDYRFADRVRGEIRRNVHVVPRLTVAVDSPLLIVPLGSTPSAHQVVVTTTSHGEGAASATVRLRLPDGWTSEPRQATVALGGDNDRARTPFTVRAPANRTAGAQAIIAEASAGGRTFDRSMQVVDYPHIERHRLYRPAEIEAQVIDLRVAPVEVGYVMGSGDQVPDALRRMGVNVTLLGAEALAAGDLARFDTIVVGVRASEARPDFAAEHARLLEWVRDGGTLIVQYQQTDYLARNLPPYPVMAQGNSRVTNEEAPVTILAPNHPVFTFPNRITAEDFAGWVQERNLYAFPSVPEPYVPLLETSDPDEDPQRGGEVYAEVGKGRYVYTAYSWFRQLPAGVPGAYRQFANLVSLAQAR